MSLNCVNPSVSSFLQSSILLKKREGRDSTPTETALGVFLIAAAQKSKAPGAHNYAHLRGGREISVGLKRVDVTDLRF